MRLDRARQLALGGGDGLGRDVDAGNVIEAASESDVAGRHVAAAGEQDAAAECRRLHRSLLAAGGVVVIGRAEGAEQLILADPAVGVLHPAVIVVERLDRLLDSGRVRAGHVERGHPASSAFKRGSRSRSPRLARLSRHG